MKKTRRNVKNGNRETFLMDIKRGETWLVNLNPTIGTEIRKKRPVIVINSDAVGVLPIRLVAPLTEWKDYFADNVWHVKVIPDGENGLSKISTVDTLQLCGLDTRRFIQKLGNVADITMESIVEAIAIIIEY